MSLKSVIYQVVSFNNSLIRTNETNSIPDNDTSPYVSEENENDGYLYLLVIDLLIFSSLTYKTYVTSKKTEAQSDSSDNFKNSLIKWLVISNALRSLSLIFIIIINNPNGNNGISWVNQILHVVPAFVFVTSYIYLAIFFSDIYYKIEGYLNHLLRPALTIMINSGYFFLALIAIITLLAKAYKSFFYISELLMALLYLVLGCVMIYCGKIASSLFEGKTSYNAILYENTLKKMSYSIGALFLLKGVSGVLEGIGLYSPPNHNVFDFFWFLILEILPTVIYIYYSGFLTFETEPADTPRETLNDNEIASQRSTSYRPSFEKNTIN
jgi:hypothetical protein